MQISHVKYFQTWIPIIAKWIHEEWAYVYPQKTFADIQKTLFGRMNENELPITLIAHDERGVLGTASLKESDLEILPDLSPWISNVYVHPDFRGTGVGRALAEEIERIAAHKGYGRLYLFNPLSQGVFEKLGWVMVKTLDYGGKELAILAKDLPAPTASAGG